MLVRSNSYNPAIQYNQPSFGATGKIKIKKAELEAYIEQGKTIKEIAAIYKTTAS